VFAGDSKATVYYLPGTTGWGATLGGRPAFLLTQEYVAQTVGNTITIVQYIGSGGSVTISNTVGGLPVVSIGTNAFYYRTNLTSVIIGDNVTNIGNSAFQACANLTSVTIPNGVTYMGGIVFADCNSLTAVYFRGNAPSLGSSVFTNDNSVTVYYLPATTGWGTTFGTNPSRPAVLWNPSVKADAIFGIQADCFGFTFTNAGSPTVVVEACTNLTSPVWSPVATNTLTGGTASFSDPDWTNHPARFYRFQMP
jgi:hypothetical protein